MIAAAWQHMIADTAVPMLLVLPLCSLTMQELARAKDAAVANEDYDEAKRLKASIERLKAGGVLCYIPVPAKHAVVYDMPPCCMQVVMCFGLLAVRTVHNSTPPNDACEAFICEHANWPHQHAEVWRQNYAIAHPAVLPHIADGWWQNSAAGGAQAAGSGARGL